MREYEARTADLRSTGEATRLFLSYMKPHKAVSSQRIANWIKFTLSEAGVSTDTYLAHSTRGASATAAAKQGVSTAQILEAADWTSENTFRKYYYRPGNDPAFAHGVLSEKVE